MGSIDEITLKKIRSGDYKAFEALYTMHYSKLCAYALSYTNDAEVAQDVVQDTFMYLWNNRHKTLITTTLKSYLYRIVYNKLMDEYRRDKRVEKKLMDYYHTALLRAIDVDEAHHEKRLTLLGLCLNKLPLRCKTIFEASKLSGKKYVKIAEEMKISIKTVEAHVTKAYKLLRECVNTSTL